MLEFAMAQRGDGDYIPNSVTLGGTAVSEKANGEEYLSKLLLLTGPNMGGKSTLLRQTCLIAIMAQLGCKVPADSCVMTPVDRIFTRVGASDRILAGQSTFFVELAETASILRAATEDSLCILDELGRGTATFDGTAIAHAVVDHLVRRVRCRTLFATHYHSLVDDWGMDPRVRLGHMDCLVEEHSKSQQEGDAESEEVTFLYRLSDGSSPRSYGINVARLARLPADVITLAVKQSRQFEEHMRHGKGGSTFQPKSDPSVPAAAQEADDGAAAGAMVNARDVTAAFFERLVSIAHSDMPVSELVYVATEMWRRFQAVR
jgi:DNA mismatch repair protein MSH6